MWALNRRQLMLCAIAVGTAALARRAIRAAFASGARTLTLYSGQEAKTTSSLVAAFTGATGVGVEVRGGKSRQLAQQIIDDGAASSADVFYSEETAPVISLSENGLLTRVNSATLSSVPAEFVAEDETWVGVSARCRAVAYNTAVIDEGELPTSILEFGTAAWRDEVGYVPTSGAFQEQIVAVERLKGRSTAVEWLKGLKRFGRPFKDNMAALRAVENGEVATALINSYCWFSLAAEIGKSNLRSALHYVDNRDAGALITISAAGALKNSNKSDLGQAFLAFLVSAAGQQIIADSVAEYPLRRGIESPFALKPWSELDPPPLTPADVGDASEAIVLEREVGLA